jgi:hypothetical protein
MTIAMAEKDEEISDSPLVAWERREYRQFRPIWKKMANQYTFTKQMYRFLAYLCGWVSFIGGGLWFLKDYIWIFAKAISDVADKMP